MKGQGGQETARRGGLTVPSNSAKFVHFLCRRQVRRAREWEGGEGVQVTGLVPSRHMSPMRRSNRVPCTVLITSSLLWTSPPCLIPFPSSRPVLMPR